MTDDYTSSQPNPTFRTGPDFGHRLLQIQPHLMAKNGRGH